MIRYPKERHTKTTVDCQTPYHAAACECRKMYKNSNESKKLTQKNSVRTQTPRKKSVHSTLPELSRSAAVVPQRLKGRPTVGGTGAAHTTWTGARCVRRLQAGAAGSWRHRWNVLSAGGGGGGGGDGGRVTRAIDKISIVAQERVAARKSTSIESSDTFNQAIAGTRGGV